MTVTESLDISEEIERAISDKSPVVVLEAMVIAHGLPQPQNFQTALSLEQIIREVGAIPATVGMLYGRMRVGLTKDEIEILANANDIKKLSTRDLAIALARQWNGATTVAATIWIAHLAGIRVFATGGIGGVHRGPLSDVSADLTELARTPMIVVCSGAKIVLDLPATREWLETHSIPVVGYGCDEMPAFYSRVSGLPVDVQCDSPEEIVQIFKTQRELGLRSALLVTVPVPNEAAVPPELLSQTLDRSLDDARKENVTGRNL